MNDLTLARELDALKARIVSSYLVLHEAWAQEAEQCGYTCAGDEPGPMPCWEKAWMNCAQVSDPIQPDFSERALSMSQIQQLVDLFRDPDFLALRNTRVGRHMWLQLKDDYWRRRLSQAMFLVEDCLYQRHAYRVEFRPNDGRARPPLLFLRSSIEAGRWLRLEYLASSELTVAAETLLEPEVESLDVDLKATLMALCRRLNPGYLFLREE